MRTRTWLSSPPNALLVAAGPLRKGDGEREGKGWWSSRGGEIAGFLFAKINIMGGNF